MMSHNTKELQELLKAKTKLLFQRERELIGFRDMRDRVGNWLQAFHDLSLSGEGKTAEGILSTFASVMVKRLNFQTAGAYSRIPSADEFQRLVGEPASKLPETIRLAGETLRFVQERRSGSFDRDESGLLFPLSEALGLEKYHWFYFQGRNGSETLILAGFSSMSAKSHPITKSDKGHFTMMGDLAAARIDNTALVSEVAKEQADLKKANSELDASLKALRKMQDELIRSTRLASVGAMAGRTAHEVLNPITSIHRRLTRMMDSQALVYQENLTVFREIVRIWCEAYKKDGATGLLNELSKKIDSGNRTFIDDDLDALLGLVSYFAKAGDEHASGMKFLLKEVDRVVHIVDSMRSLTRPSSIHSRVEIKSVLEEAVESLVDSLEKRNIRLALRANADLFAHLDSYEFIQVVTNLIRNAMFAVEEKNGRQGGFITIEAAQQGEYIQIRVHDSGCGIAKDHIPFLFESDFTTRAAEHGTGLGLGIARRLARGFGGDLILETSVQGEGSIFLLTVPFDTSGAKETNLS